MVVNSVAIAQIEPFRGAISPDGMLDKPREYFWKVRIEGTGISPVCGTSDDLGTAAPGVAGRAIPMGNAAALQNAGAVQEIVDQRVNGDHVLSGLEPDEMLPAHPYQKAGQRHRQDLVGHAEHASEEADQGFLPGSLQIGVRRACGGFQLAIDPANEVAASDVSDEQKEAVGGLIKPPIPEAWTRYGAGVDMLGLGTGEASLVVPAALVVPVGGELLAGGRFLKACLDLEPGCGPMLLHVAPGNSVRDTLKAERRKEPIENGRRIARRDSLIQTRVSNFFVDLTEK